MKKPVEFLHPLSEVQNHEGEEFINHWGFASMLCNIAVGSMRSEDGGVKAREWLNLLVSAEHPAINVSLLVMRAQAGDLAAHKQLVTLAAAGFDKEGKKLYGLD